MQRICPRQRGWMYSINPPLLLTARNLSTLSGPRHSLASSTLAKVELAKVLRGLLLYRPVNLEERSRLDGDFSSKGRASRSSTQLRFDEQIEEPDSSTTAQERWQRTDAYMRDVQSAFRNRPAVRVQSNQRYMKLLLVRFCSSKGFPVFFNNIFCQRF